MVEGVESNCYSHSWLAAAGACRTCGHSYCQDCLVFAFGRKKAPYCVGCALAAGGIRSTAGQHRTSEVQPPPASSAPKVKKTGWRARRQMQQSGAAPVTAADPPIWEPAPTWPSPPGPNEH